METQDGSTDEALFDQARRGDEDAFRILYERHAGRLRARIDPVLPKNVKRKISTGDLVQETYLVALRRGLEFEDRGDGSFQRWLDRIAGFKVHEAIRQHARTAKRAAQREVTRGRRPDTAQFAGDDTTPSQAAIAAELTEHVLQAMESLPEDYREVLRLTRDECLTLRETATRT